MDPIALSALVLLTARVSRLEAYDGAILELEDLVRGPPLVYLAIGDEGGMGLAGGDKAVIEVLGLDRVAGCGEVNC